MTIDLADLRIIQGRNRKCLEYLNVVCHTSDILVKLADTHIPEHLVQERNLIRDVVNVGRDATQNVFANAAANHHSHVIYERSLLMQRDIRNHAKHLDARLAAQARLAPYDSDKFIFGTEHKQLEADLKARLDEGMRHGYAPQASTSSAAKKQPFQGQSARANERGSGSSRGKRGGGQGQGRGKNDKPYFRDDRHDDRRDDSTRGCGSGGNGGRGGRGKK